MSIKELKAFEDALRRQRKEVIRSKTAAKKFLTELGVYQILVPKEAKNNI